MSNYPEYEIRAHDLDAHLLSVRLRFVHTGGGVTVWLPDWIPGSYLIRDFARQIHALSATIDGVPVSPLKLDRASWQIEGQAGQAEVRALVYCWDLSVRGAHVDATHAFFNHTSVCLCVSGQEHVAQTLILPPEGWPEWMSVATSLPREQVNEQGFGRYCAENYDALLDHPVEIGEFQVRAFNIDGVEHRMAFSGQFRADLDRIARDVEIICRKQVAFFGTPPPMPEYLFLVTVEGEGYGGLEHRASTALMIPRDHLPVVGDTELRDPYLEFLGLCSHEYFHTWHVKRIRPKAFIPFDLRREAHTTLLWVFEGFTSYYDDLFLLRAGIIDEVRYLALLSQTVTRVQRGPGRLCQSLSESSFDAWTRFYKQDENSPNSLVSYYAKGALLALCLDIQLRRCDSSLDALMHRLWADARMSDYQGIDEATVLSYVAALGGDDSAHLLAHWVHSREDLPLSDLLAHIGVGMNWCESQEQKNGWDSVLGATLSNARFAKFTSVFHGGGAHRAGIAAGDELLAVDGLHASAGRVRQGWARYAQGECVTLTYLRRGLLRTGSFALQRVQDRCVLRGDASLDAPLKNQWSQGE